MSVRMRHTRSHTRNRRSHHALKNAVIVKDKTSGAYRLPHRIDESTGAYRGNQIIEKKEVKEKMKDHETRLQEHKHEHKEGEKAPIHSEKQQKAPKKEGLIGRMTKGRAKARSGMGGGA